MRLKIQHCPQADAEHLASHRQYAHVFHRAGVICVARAFDRLPETHRLAVLLHEAGHVRAGHHRGERAADITAHGLSGVKIRYRSSRWGDRLEWIRPQDKSSARGALGIA